MSAGEKQLDSVASGFGLYKPPNEQPSGVGIITMSNRELRGGRGRLAAVGERLTVIARSAAAAGVELRAALQEEESAGAAGAESATAGAPQAIEASASLVAKLGELRLKSLRSEGAGWYPAHESAKEKDDKSKSQKDSIPATNPAPQQWEEVFALETPSTIQQGMSQEMGMLALETIVKNQEVMRTLMAELVKSVGAMERRICNIEQEMGLITRFTQELNELGEDNWT